MSSEREKRWRYRLGLAAEALGLDRILGHELRPEGQLQRPKSYGDSTLGLEVVGSNIIFLVSASLGVESEAGAQTTA